MEVPGLIQGDIQMNHAFGSIIGNRWTRGRIPYYIENTLGFKARAIIHGAIGDYQHCTCLRFTPKQKMDRNYISFYKGDGCNAPVGMHPGRNRISLGKGCWDRGTILHEIGHAIGMEHEHARPDRDLYVKINMSNIDGDWDYAFDVEENIDSLGTPYDLQSMMHYSSTAFAKPGTKTITTVDPSKQSLIDTHGWVLGLSKLDIIQINKMYKDECSGASTPDGNTCFNTDRKCNEWANMNLCSNSAYMKTRCKKACKLC